MKSKLIEAEEKIKSMTEKINDLEESKKYLQDALRLEKYLYSQSRKILNECLQVIFKDGEIYTPLQKSAYKKAKDFLDEH